MEQKSVIVGIEKFTSKAGKALCKLHLNRPFTERQQEHGRFGCESTVIWAPDTQTEEIDSSWIGCHVDVFYTVNGNYTSVSKIELLD